MKPGTKAYLTREAGRIGSDLTRIFLARWMKPKIEAESAETATIVTTTQKEAVKATSSFKTTETPLKTAPSVPEVATKGTRCRPCTSDHLSTCSGALSEALRFARSEGMESGEVQKRLALCVDELNIWERIDASPENLPSLSPPERDFVNRWLPRGRDLRHEINEITTLDDLIETAAKTQTMSQEARQEMRQFQPPVMRQIERLADKVKGGQLTKEQALGQLKEWYQTQPAPR